jgi:SDR family mycofactocin-dependent oxidoreductase
VGRVAGKVAFITGAARGQGRTHALRLAEEGADIIALDLMEGIATAPYEMGTAEDLAETVRAVEALDRRIVASKADVRDFDAIKTALDDGVAQLGKVDIVLGNAGILSLGKAHELSEAEWQDVIDINLTGVWHTCKAAIPHLIEADNGGSIILTSSTAGTKGLGNAAHYVAAKHGVVGLMKTLAVELGQYKIRVNTVHPTQVNTPLIFHEPLYKAFRPDLEHPTREDFIPPSIGINLIPVPWIEPEDVSNAVLFLASEEARYVTGTELRIDAGALTK